MNGLNYLAAQERSRKRGTMGDVDDAPWSGRQRFRELPYDKEVRERRRGFAAALRVLLVAAALVGLAYWLRHS